MEQLIDPLIVHGKGKESRRVTEEFDWKLGEKAGY